MLASTALLAAALLISVPAPASGTVPNREIVAASSVSSSDDTGVTVTCPEGTQRLAAGADGASNGDGASGESVLCLHPQASSALPATGRR